MRGSKSGLSRSRSKKCLTYCMALRYTQGAMKRTTIWLTAPQARELARLSKRTGIKVAELIRRFIDAGLLRRRREGN